MNKPTATAGTMMSPNWNTNAMSFTMISHEWLLYREVEPKRDDIDISHRNVENGFRISITHQEARPGLRHRRGRRRALPAAHIREPGQFRIITST
jgi:hypothetical protein